MLQLYIAGIFGLYGYRAISQCCIKTEYEMYGMTKEYCFILLWLMGVGIILHCKVFFDATKYCFIVLLEMAIKVPYSCIYNIDIKWAISLCCFRDYSCHSMRYCVI